MCLKQTNESTTYQETDHSDVLNSCTPLCRLCGRLDDLISELTRAVGVTVTAGTVTLIDLPRMAR